MLNKTGMPILTMSFEHSTAVLCQSDKARERNNKYSNKEEVKLTF
jgi:hypothetical protein